MKAVAAIITILFSTLSLSVADDKSDGGKTSKADVGGLTFAFSEPWVAAEPSSRMVKAYIEVTPEGEGMEKVGAKFYYFGAGQGGSAKANVDRWVGQFEGKPKVEEKVVDKGDGKKITLVYGTGTYLDGPPFGQKVPKAGYALHGAIIEGGDAPVFIKMTGPEKSVAAIRESFEKLAASPFAE
ncbi:MAG: hypothetical protein AAGJ79_12030 [Verrucomicrobiota bacterium]